MTTALCPPLNLSALPLLAHKSRNKTPFCFPSLNRFSIISKRRRHRSFIFIATVTMTVPVRFFPSDLDPEDHISLLNQPSAATTNLILTSAGITTRPSHVHPWILRRSRNTSGLSRRRSSTAFRKLKGRKSGDRGRGKVEKANGSWDVRQLTTHLA